MADVQPAGWQLLPAAGGRKDASRARAHAHTEDTILLVAALGLV